MLSTDHSPNAVNASTLQTLAVRSRPTSGRSKCGSVKHVNNLEASLRILKSQATRLNSDKHGKYTLSHQQQLMQRNSALERAEGLRSCQLTQLQTQKTPSIPKEILSISKVLPKRWRDTRDELDTCTSTSVPYSEAQKHV